MMHDALLVLGAIGLVCAVTIIISVHGLRRSRTTRDFYVASRRVPPWMNASAIAGEYLSAASFLGVAGLIIGIGMTADSYVVFFERIKDELRDGHRFRSAVPRAWKSASRTIVTGNVVSLIGAVVLYLLASGEVRGFAFTLALSTVFDVLVAFTLLWPMVYLASTKPLFTKPWANGLGRMESLRAESAVRRRQEQEQEQNGASDTPRGVSATVRGPDGSSTTGSNPDSGPPASTTTMFLQRNDDSQEDGR